MKQWSRITWSPRCSHWASVYFMLAQSLRYRRRLQGDGTAGTPCPKQKLLSCIDYHLPIVWTHVHSEHSSNMLSLVDIQEPCLKWDFVVMIWRLDTKERDEMRIKIGPLLEKEAFKIFKTYFQIGASVTFSIYYFKIHQLIIQWLDIRYILI